MAGAAYWYGQFFTVQSLVFGAPALTFIVKTAEPLSTALLAVLVLRRPFSVPLLLGITAACLGITLTVSCADNSFNLPSHTQWAGMVLALLANLGFSSRACIAKKAISHLRVDPFETFSMMTIIGTQTGILPLLSYGVLGHATSATGTIWALPFSDPRFSPYSWFMMCLSYLQYQTCSVLILSSIAVETHALLVAMKHMLVVVLVSILIHAHLTRGIIFGMLLTFMGVYLYMGAQDNSSKDAKEPAEESEVLMVKGWRLQEAASTWQAPTTLSGIVAMVVLVGCVTPTAIAASGLSTMPNP